LTDAISSAPLSSFEAKLLHPFGSFARDWAFAHLLFGSFAAVLAPELFFAFLALFLQTFDNVDRASSV
jgi:hypothetical protein